MDGNRYGFFFDINIRLDHLKCKMRRTSVGYTVPPFVVVIVHHIFIYSRARIIDWRSVVYKRIKQFKQVLTLFGDLYVHVFDLFQLFDLFLAFAVDSCPLTNKFVRWIWLLYFLY